MKIVIGADHGGYKLKNRIAAFLRTKGHEIADLGTHSPKSCDYPLIGYKVARGVSNGQFCRGILICKSGIGFSIVANKLPRVRAALCLTKLQARRSREHNEANILVLGANLLGQKQACAVVDVWLKTKFSGGRHARRVRQIGNIEKRILRNAK